MKMIHAKTIRHFYRRLNHGKYGLTELVAIERDTARLAATGFFNDENAFINACKTYNDTCNLYAGRNPRPLWLPKVIENYLDVRYKQRAKDKEIESITAISLDIDPIRPKGVPASENLHQSAIQFACKLQHDLGGSIDDSGNGVYLWFSFAEPIQLTDENRDPLKMKCKLWQKETVRKYQPEKYNLRIDGCFDLCRLKRVIGTFNHNAQKISQFIRHSENSDTIRNEILAIGVETGIRHPTQIECTLSTLPYRFKRLMKWDLSTSKLWKNPDPHNDTSRHDWMLGLNCVQAGISEPQELATILMNNPHGKYRRDLRWDYVEMTVRKILEEQSLVSDFQAKYILDFRLRQKLWR